MIPIRASIRLLGHLTLPTLGLVACAGNRADEDPAPESQTDVPASIEVRKLGMGTVNGNSTQVVVLPPSLVRGGAWLRFLADPIGGGRTPVSEELFA